MRNRIFFTLRDLNRKEIDLYFPLFYHADWQKLQTDTSQLQKMDDDNKGLLWKLPLVKSDQFGKLGPAFGIGAGCGLGFGAGVLGGSLHLLQFRILVTRCFDISAGKIIVSLEFSCMWILKIYVQNQVRALSLYLSLSTSENKEKKNEN